MAGASGNKQYKLAIEIAGKVASSFNSAVSKAQGTLSKLGNAVGTIGKAAAVAIRAATTAAVAFAKSSIDAGMQFDKGMAQVAATMGTTVDQIGDLRKFAMDMGAKTAFSATQAAEALNYMALAGYDAQTSMAMLPNVLNLAAAGGMELQLASDMITDAQSALGLSLEQTTTMVDQMAKASSMTNTSVSQLGDAILTVGGTAQYMAGGTAELNSVLGVLADNGIKGSEGGTHLRNILLKLASPTKDATGLLNRLGVQIFDAEGNMRSFAEIFPELNAAMSTLTDQERLDAMATLFNSRDIASATALLSTSADRWSELGDALGDCAGSAEQMANTQLDNLAGDVTLFKSALEGAQITLSDQLTPTLREFTQFGTRAVSSLSDAFREGGLSGAMAALGGVLSEGLNMIIEALPSMIDAGMQLLGALGQGLLDNLPAITDAALQVCTMLVQGIISALPSVTTAAVDLATTLAGGLSSALPDLVPTIIDAILDFIESLTNPETAAALVQAATDIMVGLGKGLIAAAPRLLEAVPTIIGNIANALVESVPILLAGLGEMFGQPGIFDGLLQIAQTIVPVIQQIFAEAGPLISGILSNIGTAVSTVAGIISSAIQAAMPVIQVLVDIFMQIASVVIPAVLAGFQAFSAGISAAISGVQTIFQGIIDFITGVFTGNWQQAWQGVCDIFSGIFQALGGLIKAPINAVIALVNRAISGINSLGITIPDWVPFIGGKSFKLNVPQIPMLAKGGIVDNPTLLEAGEAGTEAIVPLSELWSQMQGMISESIGGLTDRVAALAQKMEDAQVGQAAFPLPELIGGLASGIGGDGGAPGESGPIYQITYNPEYHIDGGGPVRDELVEAERISQAEFDRKMSQWIKDNSRKRF